MQTSEDPSLDLWTAFEAKTEGDLTLSLRHVGDLTTSGHVGACDPLVNASPDPFVMRVPSGTHPVEVLLAESGGAERVALARVVFARTRPVRFELAVCEGQDVATLRADERFGYGVDAGTGCFADEGASFEGEPILEELEACEAEGQSWASAAGYDGAWVAFSSGYGDGLYSSYFGLDEDGSPVCLVTDFQVLDVDLPAHATDRAARRRAADALFAKLEALLPELGGPEHGEVWSAAGDLGALKEDAAHLVPKLVALGPTRDAADDGLLGEVLGSALGAIASTPAGSEALASVLANVPEEMLAPALDKRGAEQTPRDLAAGLVDRWPRAGQRLRTGILQALASATDPPDAFAKLAKDALDDLARRTVSHADYDTMRLVWSAIEPLRVRGRGGAPARPAPAWLLASVRAFASGLDGETARRTNAFDVLVLQGDRELVIERLSATDPATRAAAALAMADGAENRQLSAPVLRALCLDEALDMDLRFEVASRLDGPRERCTAYVQLGMQGASAAPTQLGYLLGAARDDEALAGEIRDALAILATRAPDERVRRSAERLAKRRG